MGFLRNIVVLGAFSVAGWYGGAKYDAPPWFVDNIDQAAASASGLIETYIPALPALVVSVFANNSSDDNSVKSTEPSSDTPVSEDKPANDPGGTNTAQTQNDPDTDTKQSDKNGIVLCDTNVSNPPRADNGVVARTGETQSINGVRLVKAPVTKACFSSGFGIRGSQLHNGVDYFSDQGGVVLAAADGTILEKTYRDDYGNMVLIDHGSGVYTRYAHLARVQSGLNVGRTVSRMQVLGPIGQTGAAQAVHLHFEVLLGDYNNPKASFGLTPVDVMTGNPQ